MTSSRRRRQFNTVDHRSQSTKQIAFGIANKLNYSIGRSNQGDANTKYFHLKVNVRRRKNFIQHLKIEGGWAISHQDKSDLVQQHYATSMFARDHRTQDINWDTLDHPHWALQKIAIGSCRRVLAFLRLQRPPGGAWERGVALPPPPNTEGWRGLREGPQHIDAAAPTTSRPARRELPPRSTMAVDGLLPLHLVADVASPEKLCLASPSSSGEGAPPPGSSSVAGPPAPRRRGSFATRLPCPSSEGRRGRRPRGERRSSLPARADEAPPNGCRWDEARRIR
jgi:hypothetical protein